MKAGSFSVAKGLRGGTRDLEGWRGGGEGREGGRGPNTAPPRTLASSSTKTA